MSLDPRDSGNPEARPQEDVKIPLRPLASARDEAAAYTGWSPTAWRAGRSQAGVEKR